jgi:hypothetical protein
MQEEWGPTSTFLIYDSTYTQLSSQILYKNLQLQTFIILQFIVCILSTNIFETFIITLTENKQSLIRQQYNNIDRSQISRFLVFRLFCVGFDSLIKSRFLGRGIDMTS